MMGQDTRYSDAPCPACTGTGKNPRNRKKKCEPCGGVGKQIVCDRCFKPWPCDGMQPYVIDGSCTNPRHPREEVPIRPFKTVTFPIFKSGVPPLVASEILSVQPMTMATDLTPKTADMMFTFNRVEPGEVKLRVDKVRKLVSDEGMAEWLARTNAKSGPFGKVIFPDGSERVITDIKVSYDEPFVTGDFVMRDISVVDATLSCPECSQPISPFPEFLHNGFYDSCDACGEEFVVRRNPDRAEKKA
ncbi:hypothetical protein UFOVP1382_12 [uncultured Caudovirales phage]|uniref:Uncharacterized protein n=1 Tax=uncultured Caudovirales phage TaxID=2100421 RepID=A0A6J5S4B8_9CAUD|nr:hypothetical protein UFOVP1382_12 [uncultured Caudovirales phage]